MQLDALQRLFVGQLTGQTGNEKVFLEQLQTVRGLTPIRQLAIYKNNVIGAHLKALQQIYPVCQKILGESCFKMLGRNYTQHHPSHLSDLNLYGEAFPEVCQEICQVRAEFREYAYLPDLTRLEWYWHGLYYADNDNPFDFSAMDAVDESRQGLIEFQLSHALALHASAFPVLDIWRANQGDNEAAAVELAEDDDRLVIFRKRYRVTIERVDEPVWKLLNAIQQQHPLAGLIEFFSGATDFDFQSVLTACISKGWITGFILRDKSSDRNYSEEK